MLDNVLDLCPPLFSLGLLRTDSPTCNMKDAYERDKEFFRLSTKRNLYLRSAYLEEFDPPMEVGEWLKIPRLNVLVSRLGMGVHLVTPVYRGNEYFNNQAATDSEVTLIVMEMARQNGINVEQWVKFEAGRAKEMKTLAAKVIQAIN